MYLKLLSNPALTLTLALYPSATYPNPSATYPNPDATYPITYPNPTLDPMQPTANPSAAYS